jgi:hypothetical protein
MSRSSGKSGSASVVVCDFVDTLYCPRVGFRDPSIGRVTFGTRFADVVLRV